MMYSGTFKPRIDSTEACALREALVPLIDYLPSASDRRMASDICTKSVTQGMTSAQAHWVRQFVSKAQRFAASGRKGQAVVDADVFAPSADHAPTEHDPRPTPTITPRAMVLINEGKIIEAIKEVRSASGCGLREAKEAVEYQAVRCALDAASTQQPPAPPAPAAQQVVEIGADDLQSALKQVVEPALTAIAQQVETNAQTRQRIFNEGAARAIVDEVTNRAIAIIDRRKPVEVHVTMRDASGTERTSAGAQHVMFPTLCKLAAIRNGVTGHVDGIMLSGEQGSGKTTGCRMLAEVMGLDWHFNGAISFPHEMLGFIDGAGTYHSTPFRRAYECGGVYTFDEVDRSDPNALLAVNPHLANGLAVFPDRTIKRHPDCIITATGNTWGFGGDGLYSGATKLDSAFLSRFPRKIAWDIDEQLEAKLVTNHEWLARIHAARAKARGALGLKIVVDTRHAIAGADMIAQQGFSIAEAASFTFLAGLKAEQRAVMEGVLA
jgi:ribosomal protein L7/L12